MSVSMEFERISSILGPSLSSYYQDFRVLSGVNSIVLLDLCMLCRVGMKQQQKSNFFLVNIKMKITSLQGD